MFDRRPDRFPMCRVAGSRRTLLTALVLLASLGTPLQGAQRPVLDGTVGDEEWQGAQRFELPSGGSVLLLDHADEVFVAYRDIPQSGFGFGCAFVGIGDRVLVLHASAKLGSALYRRTDERFDPASKSYEWKDADVLWQEEGWQSHPATEHGSQEFRIAKRLWSESGTAGVALSHVSAGDDGLIAVGWPAGLDDGTRDTELLAGYNPEGLPFDIELWHRLGGSEANPSPPEATAD